ncbi:hypothetical protein G3N95_36300 [Paraburkholderia sp. Tr-20389]|uniref:hypothetical protein n=1 Tax=Paraburkholderia sp. Tr-20389 TaxID=2703903 RepID=UPI00197DF3A0|nr:hypothetical protein [Paraburkholderia sp. Tr-20389]MBN3758419.1 hypothetical protein [Paraburkholderia sp. Tr-20389]
MSFPEWGRSYNALHVPLTGDWQCSLVPACDMDEPTSWWSLSYDERQQKRKDRKRQIEQDQRDFERYFRVSTSRRAARACRDFSAYAAFISQHLRISALSAPVDGEGVTRILRDAVRDGALIPAIDRAWRGSRRVGRSYAPQSWPKRAPDPKPTIYGVRNGEFVPLDANGCFIDRTPYVPVAATASNAAVSGSGFDWLGAVETAAGAVLGGGVDDSGDVGDSGPGLVDSLTDADDSTPFGNAQAFEYSEDMPDGDDETLAGMPIKGGPPNTWVENPSGSGQLRLYDANGNAAADIDIDHDHGFGAPHSHNWDGQDRDLGNPVSILPY